MQSKTLGFCHCISTVEVSRQNLFLEPYLVSENLPLLKNRYELTSLNMKRTEKKSSGGRIYYYIRIFSQLCANKLKIRRKLTNDDLHVKARRVRSHLTIPNFSLFLAQTGVSSSGNKFWLPEPCKDNEHQSMVLAPCIF